MSWEMECQMIDLAEERDRIRRERDEALAALRRLVAAVNEKIGPAPGVNETVLDWADLLLDTTHSLIPETACPYDVMRVREALAEAERVANTELAPETAARMIPFGTTTAKEAKP